MINVNSIFVATLITFGSFVAMNDAQASCVKFDGKKGHLAFGVAYKATGRLELSPFYKDKEEAKTLRETYGGVGRFAYVLVLDEPAMVGGNEIRDDSACAYNELTIDIAQSSQGEETLKALIGRRVEISGTMMGPAENSDQIIQNAVIRYSGMAPLNR